MGRTYPSVPTRLPSYEANEAARRVSRALPGWNAIMMPRSGPAWLQIAPESGRTFPGSVREIATRPGWQGDLSSPARAAAAYGWAIEEWWIDGFTDLMLSAVKGENMFGHPRVPDSVPPAIAPLLEKELANEAAFGVKLENWLAQRAKRQ